VRKLGRALVRVDDATAARVRPVLARLGGPDSEPSVAAVREYLSWRLSVSGSGADEREAHEVAWALGDLFEHAGLTEQAAVCRAPQTHRRIAVRRWAASFPGVPPAFWTPALQGLDTLPEVPQRVRLSLAGATGLLDAVGPGLRLRADGTLPVETVRALDDRFRWTEDFPWMHPTREQDIPPLTFLRRHLTGQRLLVSVGDRLEPTEQGIAARHQWSRLWRAVVDPQPRWSEPFELDTLGVMAASLLRAPAFTPGRVAEELTAVLAAKWRSASDRSVFERASLVVQEWYQVGVPLGWWDSGRGPADRRPNAFGRAAAGSVFRAVGGRSG
jgi:hypothetical protein